MKHIINFFKGILVGLANVIPGVSGGTMAVITGIYEKIIGILSSFLKNLRKKNWKQVKEDILYAIPIILGGVVGIVLFSKLMQYLLEHHNMPTIYCFLGLIIGSIPLLFKSANKHKFNFKYLIPFAITALFMVGLAFLNNQTEALPKIEAFGTSPLELLLLVLYGMIAAATMIIPGISGSMVMMILGIYNAVIAAVSSLNILVLIPFGIGIIIGIIVTSKIIEKLLEKFYSYTYYGILGFVLGSIIFIFPGFAFNTTGIISILTFVIGIAASYGITKLGKE